MKLALLNSQQYTDSNICREMVLFNEVRVSVSLGSIFSNNPYLAVLGSIFMSFFEFGKQTLRFFIQKDTPSDEALVLGPSYQAEGGLNLFEGAQSFCESLIDAFTPQSQLIVGTISQQLDWVRNGQRKGMDN